MVTSISDIVRDFMTWRSQNYLIATSHLMTMRCPTTKLNLRHWALNGHRWFFMLFSWMFCIVHVVSSFAYKALSPVPEAVEMQRRDEGCGLDFGIPISSRLEINKYLEAKQANLIQKLRMDLQDLDDVKTL